MSTGEKMIVDESKRLTERSSKLANWVTSISHLGKPSQNLSTGIFGHIIHSSEKSDTNCETTSSSCLWSKVVHK